MYKLMQSHNVYRISSLRAASVGFISAERDWQMRREGTVNISTPAHVSAHP